MALAGVEHVPDARAEARDTTVQVRIGGVAGELVMPAVELEAAAADAAGVAADDAAEMAFVGDAPLGIAVGEHHVAAVGDAQACQVAAEGRDARAQRTAGDLYG